MVFRLLGRINKHYQLFRSFAVEPYIPLDSKEMWPWERTMALENRSKPQQMFYLLLTFAGLIAVLAILARWSF
jgi:hypothetical protein